METLTAQEELAFIRKVMEDSRASFVDNGKPKLVWGAIVALGMLYTYIQALADSDLYVMWVWLGISAFGWGYIFWEDKQRDETSRTRTQTGKIIGAIWGACGFSIGLVVALAFGTRYFNTDLIMHPLALCPITAIIIGIAYFLDGTIRLVPWVRNLAYAWWASAVLMFFWPSVHTLLIYAFMIIAFQFIPGIILYQRSKKLMLAA
jgi:hypothetical protein